VKARPPAASCCCGAGYSVDCAGNAWLARFCENNFGHPANGNEPKAAGFDGRGQSVLHRPPDELWHTGPGGFPQGSAGAAKYKRSSQRDRG
jgi:hypothetical protein